MKENNFFIKQFGNPAGAFGRFLSLIMNISNRKMYRANAAETCNAKRILEIGFGNGKQLLLLHKRYPESELYGIDISEDMLVSAGKRLAGFADLSKADAADMPYESAFFDAVITTDTCYFWKDPETVLAEIGRVLRSGGVFINSMNTMYAGSVGKTCGGACICSTSKLAALIKDSGFVVSKYDKLSRFEEQIVIRKL